MIVKEHHKRICFGNLVSVYELSEEEAQENRQYPNGVTVNQDVIRTKCTNDDGTIRVIEQTPDGISFISA